MKTHPLEFMKLTASYQIRLKAIFTLLVVGFSCLASPAMSSTLIEISLARHVAAEHVHANNRPYQWRFLDLMVLHDVDGNPAAYAFVFAKAQSWFHTPADLHQHIHGEAVRLRGPQGKRATAAGDSATPDGEEAEATEDSLYAFDDLATVITGATSDSPLILRHFRGIPEFWVEAVTLGTPASSRRSRKPLTATHVLIVTPMDYRLVTSDVVAGVSEARDRRKPERAALSEAVRLLPVRGQREETLKALRKARQTATARDRQRIAEMRPEDRQRYEAALQDRTREIAAEWQKRRDTMTSKRGAEVEQ